MSWARFDDLYDDNRKIKRAWRRHPRAVGLHAMAITYSSRHETDGVVDIDWLEEKLPKDSERQKVLAVLIDVGLLERVDDDNYIVHDYLDFNPSKATLDAKRAADAARKRGRPPTGVQTDSERTPDGSGAESDGSPDDASRDTRTPAPAARPDPSRPFPFPLNPPPSGGRKRSHEVWDKTAVAWARSIGVTGHDSSLLKAVTQARPWDADDPIQHFHRFVAQWFPGSLEVEEAA